MTAVAERPGLLSGRDAKLRASRVIIYALLILGTVVFVLPFLWMVSTALKQSQEDFTFPPTFWPSSLHWQNFTEGWTVLPFSLFLFNTLLITTLAVAGNMVSCILPAFNSKRITEVPVKTPARKCPAVRKLA